MRRTWLWYPFFWIPKYCLFCLHTFTVILCLWKYRKCMAETLFNKIISSIAILSKFILPHLLFWKIKNPKLHIMNTFHRFELLYKPLNFSPSCPDYPWCTQERDLVYFPGSLDMSALTQAQEIQINVVLVGYCASNILWLDLLNPVKFNY